MRRIRTLLTICLIIGCILVIVKAHNTWTGGLNADGLRLPPGETSSWTPNHPYSLSQREVKILCSQPLSYLGKGAQSYTLATTDPRYVIKCFKAKHLTKGKGKRRRLTAAVQSAYDFVSKETGILYVDLDTSCPWGWTTTVLDKAGRPHQVDMGQVAFYVQERAIPLREALATAKAPDALRILAALKTTLVSRCAQGISDTDTAILQNFGLVGDRVIQFDVGQLKTAPVTDLAEELRRIDRKLRQELSSLKVLNKNIDDILPIVAFDVDPAKEGLLPKPGNLPLGVVAR